MELLFIAEKDEEGGYTARAAGHSIFTEAQTWEELQANADEVAALHFDDPEVRTVVVLSPAPER